MHACMNIHIFDVCAIQPLWIEKLKTIANVSGLWLTVQRV